MQILVEWQQEGDKLPRLADESCKFVSYAFQMNVIILSVYIPCDWLIGLSRNAQVAISASGRGLLSARHTPTSWHHLKTLDKLKTSVILNQVKKKKNKVSGRQTHNLIYKHLLKTWCERGFCVHPLLVASDKTVFIEPLSKFVNKIKTK